MPQVRARFALDSTTNRFSIFLALRFTTDKVKPLQRWRRIALHDTRFTFTAILEIAQSNRFALFQKEQKFSIQIVVYIDELYL